MMEPTTALALDLAVTIAWFVVAGAALTVCLYLALVALPAARSWLHKPRIDWGDGMSTEALQRLQRVLWEEDEKERRKP